MKLLILFALIFVFLGASALPTTVTGKNVQDAKPVEVGAANKKGLVAIFLSAKCPCSNSHLEEVRKLSQDFPEFAFVGVHSNTEEAKEPTQAYFKSANLPFPVIQDSEMKIAEEFKASKTPHAFVVLKDGTLAFHGGVSDSRDFGSAKRKHLREALTQLHENSKVSEPYVRTLGCAISRGGKSVW